MSIRKLLNLKYDYIDLMIVEALAKYSPRNIFKIARELNMPESTVRYRINILRKKGLLRLYTNVYHTNIGLKKAVVFADINPKYWRNVYDFMDANGYWLYMVKLHGNRETIHTLYTIPVEHISKLNDFLDEMVNLDILRDYKVYHSTCFHRVNPTTTWYDLKNETWIFPWENIINEIEEADTKLPITLKDPEKFPIKADETDIMILRYLEQDATISYTQLAEYLGSTPQNIRYHFKQHIEKNFLIEDYEILFMKFPPNESFIVYAILEFPNYTSLAKVANTFRDKPFTEVLGKILEQYKLVMVSYVPMTELIKFINMLNDLVVTGFLKGFEYYLASPMEPSRRQTIPYKMFSNGKWMYPHDEMLRTLHEKLNSLNSLRGRN